MNYSIYFPVQLWVYEKDGSSKYRLQPPREDRHQYEFYPHFLDSYGTTMIDPELKKLWHLRSTFWGINIHYQPYLRRGMLYTLITQNDEHPFESSYIAYSIMEMRPSSEKLEKFMFGHYKYPVQGTMLLYVSAKIHDQKIIDVLLLDDEQNRAKEKNKKYNFLPLQENKDIPFYEIFAYDLSLFLFVFPEKPKGIYWKSTQENICIPSTNPNDYPTAIGCAYDNNDKIYPKDIFLESNNKPFFTILHDIPPEKTSRLTFILIISILLLSIISLWLWKKYQGKKSGQ